MKICKKYNMKEAFEAKCDWDFTINLVRVTREYGVRITYLVPVHRFTLFGVTVIEARKITKSINVLPQYICTLTKIDENEIDF